MRLYRDEYDILVVLFSWIVGFAPVILRRAGWTWTRAVGLALLASPFVRFGIDISLTVDQLFTFTILQPIAADALWRGIESRWIEEILFPLAGLVILYRGRLAEGFRAEGLGPRATVSRDALRGLSLFFFIAAAFGLALLLSQTVLAVLSSNGIETGYWRNITIPLIIALSATAGLAEEFLFRGVLLTRLSARIPWIAAALVQALAFGLVHAGYGTWTHVVGPFFFGLGMAWVAHRLGVIVTAMLHAEVNMVFFVQQVGPDYVAANGTLGLVGLALLLGGLALGAIAALIATRGDAVAILWRDVTWPLRRARRGADAPTLR